MINAVVFGLTFFAMLFSGSYANAGSATVAVAAGMKFAMDEIAGAYRSANPMDTLQIVYGATGKLQTQIQQGAPFDMFFSADTTTPMELAKAGFAGSKIKIYAIGHLVLWSTTMDATTLTVADLAQTRFTRIAIANPKIAPYGKRAEEALRASNVWETVSPRLVLGESITQAAQFVESGNAQVGLIALSLALSPELQKKGGYTLVPEGLHQPLEQGFILTKKGMGNDVANRLAKFMETKEATDSLRRYGYTLPETQKASSTNGLGVAKP
jgi:molybdate transport system substrate-binding protein